MTAVAVAALGHGPGLTGFPDRAPPAQIERLFAHIEALAARVAEFNPDLIIGVSNDHFTATSLELIPPFLIASSDRFANPASTRLAQFLQVDPIETPGVPQVAELLARELIDRHFDIALHTGPFGFDENFAVPGSLLGLRETAFVPLIVNAVQAPMPTLARCVDLGTALGAIVRSAHFVEATGIQRVLVLATGGLSHSVGTPDAGRIDHEFDETVLSALAAGDLGSIADLKPERVAAAGNGAEEIRQWIIAAAVAAPAGMEILGHEPIEAFLSRVAVGWCRPT